MKLDYQHDHKFSFSKRENLDYGLHAQGEVEFGFMLSGSCTLTCGNTVETLRAGDAFMVFPNQPHKYENSADLTAYLLIVPVKRYLSVYHTALTKNVPTCPILRKGEWDPGLLSLVESGFADFGRATESVMQGYLMVIIGKLLESMQLQEQRTGTEEALRRVLAYLNDHYREDITRKDIARAVGYNESYVSHLFSDTMHSTLPEYIHALRIDDACRLLLETDMTVSQIASQLGFASIRNFNRVFLKRIGSSPRQYREQAKK